MCADTPPGTFIFLFFIFFQGLPVVCMAPGALTVTLLARSADEYVHRCAYPRFCSPSTQGSLHCGGTLQNSASLQFAGWRPPPCAPHLLDVFKFFTNILPGVQCPTYVLVCL